MIGLSPMALNSVRFSWSFSTFSSSCYPKNRLDNHHFAGCTLRFLKRPIVYSSPSNSLRLSSQSSHQSSHQLHNLGSCPAYYLWLPHQLRFLSSHFNFPLVTLTIPLIQQAPLGKSIHSRYKTMLELCLPFLDPLRDLKVRCKKPRYSTLSVWNLHFHILA